MAIASTSGPPVPSAGRPAGAAARLGLGERLLFLATGLGVLHHVDHVLRVDHSGWPFRPDVTPFTFSLLVYPVILSVHLARSHPWYQAAATALVLLFTQMSHIVFETPRDQFETWAVGSTDLAWLGQPTLLGVQSPLLGVLAADLSIALSAVLLAATVTFVREARGRRRAPTAPPSSARRLVP